MTKEHVYEVLLILNTDAYARNPEEVSGAVAKTIEELGGTVRVSRFWDERKLAYPIKSHGQKHKRGVYWLTYFRMATDKLVDLNRQFQLNGNIVRFLIQTIDPRLEETLVAYASAGPVQAEAVEGAAEGGDVYAEDEAEEENEAEE
ncbi:MAG: 30S ribosomal protein S6 [Thermoguttaceae bacterium]|nr:30S ribosomal protein S6 [Thermoguttaceae bacterium]